MKRLIIFLICLINLFLNLKSQPINPWTPPEFFPSKAVLIEWDFNQSTWSLYSKLIEECSEIVQTILVVNNQAEENYITQNLLNDAVSLENIVFVHVPCERMWIRDHGPLSVNSSNGIVFIDFDDYANSGLDENLPTNLANLWGLISYQLPYVVDGGNFMVDNYNTLFATSRLYSNNPNVSKSIINQMFQDYMGITNIVTFKSQHNDYWGHIDMQIKLLDDTTFIISSVTPSAGANYDSLEANYLKLKSLTAPNGKPYRIEKIAKADNWKSYVNSLILNNKVIVPVYDHYLDSHAISTYQQLLPNHHIVGINSNQIIGWEGAIHCITMQLFDDSIINQILNLSLKDKFFEAFPNPISRNSLLNIHFSSEKIQNV